MNEYYEVQVFPLVGNDSFPARNFKFNGIHYFLIDETRNRTCKVVAGRSTSEIKTDVKNLYIQKKENDISPWIAAERACDLLSLANGNHISCYTVGICEYANFNKGGFGTVKIEDIKNIPKEDTDSLLNKFAEKIESSGIKDRLLAAIHLNRIAKIKSFTHLTEAFTDSVCSAESVYLKEKDNSDFQEEIDTVIITDPTINGNKTKAFNWFVSKYFPSKGAEQLIQKIKPYKVRSAYLHRGVMISPKEADQSSQFRDLESAKRRHLYNEMMRCIYKALANFILKS
jgi:N-glycosylase/DNA lyase